MAWMSRGRTRVKNDDEDCRVWNLIFEINGQRKIEYTHLRGNSKLIGEKYKLRRQEAKDAPMGRKTIEFELMTPFVDSPRNAVLVGADEDLFAALPDAVKTEALALKIQRDQAMQRAMAKISEYLANPSIPRRLGRSSSTIRFKATSSLATPSCWRWRSRSW